jgi:hypothetical protein
MRRKVLATGGILLCGILAAGIYVLWHQAGVRSVREKQTQDENAIQTLVLQFGEKLKNVPLLAPKAVAAKAIEENYGSFVSADILAAWKADPTEAPGRLTSSPWPKGIDITSIIPNTDGSYDVQGKVMAVTSADLGPQGVPITEGTLDSLIALRLRKEGGRWLITGFQKAVPQSH